MFRSCAWRGEAGTNLLRDLVLNKKCAYMAVIGIAQERWNASVARNSLHRLMLLTTDVLALVGKR